MCNLVLSHLTSSVILIFNFFHNFRAHQLFFIVSPSYVILSLVCLSHQLIFSSPNSTSLFLSLSLTLTHTLSLSLSITDSLSHSLSLSLSQSLTHFLSQSLIRPSPPINCISLLIFSFIPLLAITKHASLKSDVSRNQETPLTAAHSPTGGA